MTERRTGSCPRPGCVLLPHAFHCPSLTGIRPACPACVVHGGWPPAARPRSITTHDPVVGVSLPLALNSEILFLMAPNPETDLVEVAVLSGGPMDGHEHSIENGAGELFIVMTDGQQHRYVRTDEFQVLPDGRSALVFEWTGRYFGPK